MSRKADSFLRKADIVAFVLSNLIVILYSVAAFAGNSEAIITALGWYVAAAWQWRWIKEMH